jgi:hypothetical protein
MTADGEHLLAVDFAGIAGTENEEQNGEFGAIYEFSRTPVGWNVEALEPPASRFPRSIFVAASADLSRSLWKVVVAGKEGEEQGGGATDYIYFMRDATAGGARFTSVGPQVAPGSEPGGQQAGFVSGDGALGHMVIDVGSEHKQLWPGDKTAEGAESLYEYNGTSSAEPVLVGVKNAGPLEGKPHVNEGAELVSECGTILGSYRTGSVYNALSANGAFAYFTAQHVEGCSGHQPPVDELYSRINGSQTVAVSEPAMTAQREIECTGVCREDENGENGHERSSGRFEGASEDGSRVFFTTEQPLLNGDEDSSPDLYEAVLEGGAVKRLVQVSHSAVKGQAANVVSVGRISRDGSHVYYVANGVLTTKPNGNGEAAEEGGYNLYVYDTHREHTSFVANLLTRGERKEVEAGEFARTHQTLEELEKELEAELEGNVRLEILERTDELEENRALKTKPLQLEEEKAEIEAKRAEVKATIAGIAARKAECNKDREKGKLKLAEECEAKVKVEEGTLAGEETELKEDEAVLKKTEQELAHKITQRIVNWTGVGIQDEQRPFATTPDGGELMFVSGRHLTGSEDTSTVDQVFEYDAQTERLVRVSVGQRSAAFPGGYGDNGNTTDQRDAPEVVRTPEYGRRMLPTEPVSKLSLSENGTVVFSSRDALTPLAVSGRENVYQYRNGNVYLVSAGNEAVPVQPPNGSSRLLGTDETGRDVFFYTNESLVPQDTNTQADWYDARGGGGFPATPAQAGCEGDACQGAPSGTPLLSSAGGSATQAPGENLAPPAPAPAKKPLTQAQRLARALRACQKQPRRKRAACVRRARRRYGHVAARARKRHIKET